MTNNEIKQAIENFEDTNYEPVVWAIRAHHNSYGEFEYVAPEVGGELENSYVWHDGNTTSEQLDGVCALEISDIDTAIDMIKSYPARNYVLIAVDAYTHGEDAGEIICNEYEVVSVW